MNISLFDNHYSSFSGNRYAVSHFHIYIGGELEWPFEKNDDRMRGILIHEYIHYYQHLSTLCGISIAQQYNRMFRIYREYFESNKSISLPLRLGETDERIVPFFDYFNRIKGDFTYCNRIDGVSVEDGEIEMATKDHRAVLLNAYNNERSEWNAQHLQFGYYSIIESMADMVQSYMDPTVEHDVSPYKIVQKICEVYYPEVVGDKRFLIAMCVCSLMSSNPGTEFFKVIQFAKDHQGLNGAQLYSEYIISNHIVRENGQKDTILEWFNRKISAYKNSVEQALGCLDYYGLAMDCALKCAQSGDNLLLILLYDECVKPIEYLGILGEYYGYPYIEAENQILYPGREAMPQDVVAAVGMELIYNRVSNNNSVRCPRYSQCERNHFIEYECVAGDQWNIEKNCPFTASLHYYGLKNKDFIPSLG